MSLYIFYSRSLVPGSGQTIQVKMLRDRRANMWLRNAKGDLPLHEAASSGRRELVQWLLDQRPKQVNTPSNDGRTILHIAAGNDYTDMCKVYILLHTITY